MEAEQAVRAIVDHLSSGMEQYVPSAHPAAESLVAACFDLAPAVPGLERIRVAGEEMRLLVEVTTGIAADGGTIRTFVFPDRPRPPGHGCARLLRARAGAGFVDDQNRIVPRAVIP